MKCVINENEEKKKKKTPPKMWTSDLKGQTTPCKWIIGNRENCE